MSGKGFDDDDDQTPPGILTLALGWTNSLIYAGTMYVLIVAVEIYLFWPLLPNYPHVWGDDVIGMVIAQYCTGVLGYAAYVSPWHPFPVLLGRFSHLCGNVAILKLLAHVVSHHILVWIAIPSSLWFGSVFLFSCVHSFSVLNSASETSIPSQRQLLLC